MFDNYPLNPRCDSEGQRCIIREYFPTNDDVVKLVSMQQEFFW